MTAPLVLRRAQVVSPERGRLGLCDIQIAEGAIVAVEPYRSGTRWPNECTAVDLEGVTVVPGLIDAHFHLFATGAQLLTIDLSGAASVTDVLALLADGAQAGEWRLAAQLNEEQLTECRLPTLAELDAAVPDAPLFIEHRSLHFALCNSEATRRLDVRDAAGSDGILQFDAVGSARQRLIASHGEEYVEHALRAASRAAAERGVTTVHAMEGGDLFGDTTVDVLQRIQDSLPTDVVVYWCGTDVPHALDRGYRRVGGDAFVDGTLGSSTAALKSPYADDAGSRGELHLSEQQVSDFFAAATAAHLQAGLHVIGGRAIEVALRAIERAASGSDADARCRLEHCGDVSRQQLRRAARLGVAISTQPAFTYLRGGPGGVYEQRLGRQRAKRLYPLRWMLDAGVHVGGGSDSPVTPADPLLGLESAVNARYPAQRVEPLEALRMFTSEAAWCAGEEQTKGDIRPGMQADILVLGDDPLTCDPTLLHEIEIGLVLHRGEPVCGSLLKGESWQKSFRTGANGS
jgi:predicted amidohydrolase YtcJ